MVALPFAPLPPLRPRPAEGTPGIAARTPQAGAPASKTDTPVAAEQVEPTPPASAAEPARSVTEDRPEDALRAAPQAHGATPESSPVPSTLPAAGHEPRPAAEQVEVADRAPPPASGDDPAFAHPAPAAPAPSEGVLVSAAQAGEHPEAPAHAAASPAAPAADGAPNEPSSAPHGETGDAPHDGAHQAHGSENGSEHGGGHETGHGSGPAHGPLPPDAPVYRVRELQRLQDRIAAGDVAGVAEQRVLIAEMDQALAKADPAVWRVPANARVLISYFLSGGSPAVLRAIVTRAEKPAIDEKLLLGTLFYLEGREESALRELGEVDARTLPNTIGGQVALVQAALVVRKDPEKASRLLALARLLLPGTLVEEAALRRQILVAAQSGNAAAFERLSGDYLFRFRHSAYAGNFRQRFAAALTRMSFVSEPGGMDRLDSVLKTMEPDGRRDIYLLVSRGALVEGKTELAAATAARALALAPPASSDAERAQVYMAAAKAVSPDAYQAATAALGKVDRGRLDASDAALMDAALSAADTVRRADEPQVKRGPTTVAPARLPQEDTAPPPAILTRAEETLKSIDGLLKDAPQ